MSNLTLQQKKAYFAKSRESNYEASLRLEGFKVIKSDADGKLQARDASGVARSRQG